jgi:dienelactone hydrolase
MRDHLPSGRPVELARPSDGRAPTRGLVVLPDIGGLRPVFDAHVARLADEQGWAVAGS